MKIKTYSEKLKDPRWQKKRLEILNRDEFKCVLCGDNEMELHVHHKEYFGEPFEVSNDKLETLCKSCHFLLKNIDRSRGEILYSKKYTTPNLYYTTLFFCDGYVDIYSSDKNFENYKLNIGFVYESASVLDIMTFFKKCKNGSI